MKRSAEVVTRRMACGNYLEMMREIRWPSCYWAQARRKPMFFITVRSVATCAELAALRKLRDLVKVWLFW
jgi:hypothetical protein